MNKNRFTISIMAGIVVVLLLIEGTGETVILITHAQTATLGEGIKTLQYLLEIMNMTNLRHTTAITASETLSN